MRDMASNQNFAHEVPWYRRGWALAIIFTSLFLLLCASLFARQVYIFYKDLKAGKKPAFLVDRRYSGTLAYAPTVDPAALETIKQRVTAEEGDPFIGPATSTNEIIEFLDFDCPYSKSSAKMVHDLLARRPDVKIVFRDFPLLDIHPDAELAAKAARCIWRQNDPEMYLRYHDLLFANQEKHDLESLKGYASQVGADSRFVTCVEGTQVQADIQQSVVDAKSVGVSVTPTFFVDGQMVEGAADLNTMLGLIK